MSKTNKKHNVSVNIKLNKDDDQAKINELIKNRIYRAREIIIDTIISVQLYRKYGLFSNSEVNICITSLKDLHNKTIETFDKIGSEQIESTIDSLQIIIDKLTAIISTFGTKSVDDLIYMTFGSGFIEYKGDPVIVSKFNLIRKYVHPTGFKISSNYVNTNTDVNCICIDKITDDVVIIESSPQFECFTGDTNTSSFHNKVHGIKVVLRCDETKKTMIMSGITDDINLDMLDNAYIYKRKRSISSRVTTCNHEILKNQLDAMTLKDILTIGDSDIFKKNVSIVSLSNTTKSDKLDKTLKRFTSLDTFEQRNTLIDLLTCSEDGELKYITYLLYDVITSSSGANSDLNEQAIIYDSFPWAIKRFFKDAMKHTMNYTHQVAQKYDISRISLEQQVYAMRAEEPIKEKALLKLKEIKNKSDDSNGKARQYLEGLLKIPFGIYREEPILKSVKLINADFLKLLDVSKSIISINKRERFTNMEIYKYLGQIEVAINDTLKNIHTLLDRATKSQIGEIIKYINDKSIKWYKLKTKCEQINEIKRYVDGEKISRKLDIALIVKPDLMNIKQATNEIEKIRTKLNLFEESLIKIDNVFDASIHGQTHAKNQLKKIICQWITGEQKGHCFGFEGSPGIGKTSLAKYGLANCLKDETGTPRPFAFIPLGGACNGSTLEGHGYTYLNSTWGLLASWLMRAECMNLIFYFDEADKLSKEHGSEINGILTHLTDTTQNDEVQDKFFSGVPLNLAKALFIFSYNDPNLIDKVLLDRIHRIKFENLTVEEKIVIARDYIIPNINKDMGLTDVVNMSNEVIEYIILTYTLEPGVRKLKEVIFDLYGEINIQLLKQSYTHIDIPIIITTELIGKYLNKYTPITEQKIRTLPTIATVNGLYANSLGKGGIIQISASFFPSNTFLELKLTGLQGDVMKESMNVAKTLAWSLCSQEVKDKWLKLFETTKDCGVHIHCPEGAVGKDGPSAGVASFLVIYSLLIGKLINNIVAITGEVDLRGNVMPIGGLEYKIEGGIRAGVTKFLYPKENHSDFVKYTEKYGIKDNIEFIEVSNIQDTIEHVFI
uniref:Lon proteolytic domain-containing protein n=1 Tax=viral metagenome TaxID=1070528 RepID=A0A6C0F1A7_9ZZZZ